MGSFFLFLAHIYIMTDNFSLKWNNFQSNVAKSFSNLRKECDFFDVTLVGDDQQQLSAHKVVLSACSEYFKNTLKQNKHSNPLICIEGVNFKEMNNILNYIYQGETNVNQNELERFLHIAQRFKLEGLTPVDQNVENNGQQFIGNDDGEDLIEAHVDHPNIPESSINKIDVNSKVYKNVDLIEAYVDKSNVAESKINKIVVDLEAFKNVEELDEKILEYIAKDETGKWKCLICGKQCRYLSAVKEHVEIHFDGISFPCKECGTTYKSRGSLRDHNKKHK